MSRMSWTVELDADDPNDPETKGHDPDDYYERHKGELD